jgi:hypothetical protein
VTIDHHDVEIDREIADSLRRANVRLHDLHAARLSAGIEAALDEVAAQSSRKRHARRTAGMAVLVLGVGAMTAAAVLSARHVVRPASPVTPAVAVVQEPRLLVPYLYSGTGAEEQTLGATRRLVVSMGARVRATIGTRVRLTLVGPGELAIEQNAESHTIGLVLDRGQLLVDYDGRGRGSLHVRSPGAVTTVVGTLFSVEALNKATRVAVARGRVLTEAAGAVHTIVAGAAWSAGEGTVAPMSRDVAVALAEHDESPPPPIGEYGIVRVDSAQPSAPSRASALALDGRLLGELPVIARVPAGGHLLGVGARQTRIDVSGGNTIHVDRQKMATPAEPPAVASHVQPGVARKVALDSPSSHEVVAAGAPPLSDAESIEAAYLAAEAAMRSGRSQDAQRALEDVMARDPGGARSQAALLDLARLSLEAGEVAKARRYLGQLPDPGRDSGLAGAAHHLRCRLAVRQGDDAETEACLLAFRSRYPRSPHDAESLAVLASVARTCATMQPRLEEYLRLYPRGAFARDAKARLDACASSPLSTGAK